jgi:hypothetical protein
MRHCLIALACCAGLAAADPASPPDDAVARVDGVPILRRELERALLRREGADQIIAWMRDQVDCIDWDRLPDDAVVLAVGGHELRKRDLAASLLRSKGGKVREDLISQRVVENALAKAGVVVDEAMLRREWRLMERAFQAQTAGKGMGQVDFASYLQAQKKLTPAEFLKDPAVRMLAGLHELLRRRQVAAISDEAAQEARDRDPARFDQAEAVELACIHLPFRAGDTPAERERLLSVLRSLSRQVESGQNSFLQLYEVYGRSWDPDSDPRGSLGWVDRDGRRGSPGARRLPREAIEPAFAAQPPFPRILPPVAHAGGADLIQVLGHRPARPATPAEVRDLLAEDLLGRDLEGRTAGLLAELRRAADIEHLDDAGKADRP